MLVIGTDDITDIQTLKRMLFNDSSSKRKLVNILLEFQVKGCLNLRFIRRKDYILSLYSCREADIR